MNALEELKSVSDVYGLVTGVDLKVIADHIESEWIKLPLDKDGEVIHIGDKVKETGDDNHLISNYIWNVVGVAKNTVYIVPHSGACNITHLASDMVQIHVPDTWDQIEADIADITNEATAQDVVRRCKALAGVDDE